MTRLALLVSLIFLCACQPGKSSAPAPTPPPSDAVLVLPGAFSQRTTLSDLEARFGKSNLKIVEIPASADTGSSSRSVVLFPADPSRRAYVNFHDAERLIGLASISVRDTGSRWRGKHGVRVGMSLADLQRLNGKPFGFAGFDSQQRAWAHDQWSPARDGDDGRLGALDVAEGEHMYFGVELGLRGNVQNLPAGTYPVDDSVSSDDLRYPRLGELVEVTAITASTSLDDEWE
jgi:hypothetical protein